MDGAEANNTGIGQKKTGFLVSRAVYDEEEEKDSDDEEGIDEKAKAYDTLAEFANMENAAMLDFESWE